MAIARHGGQDRVSTKTKLAAELSILGRVLTAVRERAGLRQLEVAARLSLPASYLSKIEKGTRRVDVVELIAISKAIGVEASDVIREVEQALVAAAINEGDTGAIE